MPGTTWPLAGFPTLTTIQWDDVSTEFMKLNVFGSDSKYRSMMFQLEPPDLSGIGDVKLKALIGKSVFVNYPQLHEALVVAVRLPSRMLRGSQQYFYFRVSCDTPLFKLSCIYNN